MEDCPVSVQFRVKQTAVLVQSAGEADRARQAVRDS